MKRYDVIVCGSGPAGSVCAAWCAASGLKTLLLDRASFPRDKVCGDCLNPSCWDVFDRLQISQRVAALTHARVGIAELIPRKGKSIAIPFQEGREIAVKRRLLDSLLLDRAIECGAEFQGETAVTGIRGEWTVESDRNNYGADFVVGADGRNSLVARQAGLQDRQCARNRIALQTRIPLVERFRGRVALQILEFGYGGFADIGGGELNICLVGRPETLAGLHAFARKEFQIEPHHPWQSVAPLTRSDALAARPGIFLVGDAAKVVEPFTGEGIYYAMRSGELAAGYIVAAKQGRLSNKEAAAAYSAEHRNIYRRRLWVNRLARAAVLHPGFGDTVIKLGRRHPALLRYLTAKIAHIPAVPDGP